MLLESLPVTETEYVLTGVLRDVDTVSVEVTALALPIVTEDGSTEHLGVALPTLFTLHERATLPV